MRRWTISGLLGLVALLALGMAELRDSEGEWAEAAPMVAVGLIAIAVLRRGRSPGLFAFAVLGGLYLIAS